MTAPPAAVLDRPTDSRAVRARAAAWRGGGLLALAVLLVGVFLLGIGIGSRSIGLAEAWTLVWSGGDGPEAAIVRELRIPRGVLAIVVGAALGTAGALMQGLTRNPLADPGLLGVNAGASAAVVLAIGVGITEPSGYLWFAVLGAGLTMTLVYVLGATGRGAASPDRLVLAGAAVTAVLVALIQAALVLSPRTFDEFRFWNLGSLAGRGADVVVEVTPVIVVGLVLALLMARSLDALALGDRTGAALGVRPTRVRIAGGLLITLLCGAATAAAGPIAFLGLAVPHVVRSVVGPDHRWLLPYSVLLAPIVLLVADVVGRVVAPPSEVQVGVMTALLGVPVFVALCRRRRLVSL